MSSLRRNEKKQNIVDDKVPCFVTEGSPSKDEAQPRHREAVIGFLGSTEAETRTEHTTCSTVLEIEKEPVALDRFTMDDFFLAQRDERFCRECSESVGDPQSCFD